MRAQRILVLYAFSPSGIISQLQRYGLQALRAPVTSEHVWQQCQLSQSRLNDRRRRRGRDYSGYALALRVVATAWRRSPQPAAAPSNHHSKNEGSNPPAEY